jgi:hypothetical protein
MPNMPGALGISSNTSAPLKIIKTGVNDRYGNVKLRGDT